jgi:hypothetical protein
VGAVVLRALEAAEEEAYRRAHQDGGERADASAEQRRAAALGLVAAAALGGGLGDGLGGRHRAADRYQVVVHAEADLEGAVLEDGERVSAETCRRLACDASVVAMVDGPEGETLSVGRKTRTIPPAIRRALERRDRGCRFPGCGSRFCDAHHVEHWADGGTTSLGNLLLLCKRHHRAVHEEGFTVDLGGDGEACFRRPDGRQVAQAPALPRLAADPVGSLRVAHRERGLEIAAETVAAWDGSPFDCGEALEGFLGLEVRAGGPWEGLAGRFS